MVMFLFLIYLIIALVIELWIIFRCHGIKECFNKDCKYRVYCRCHRYCVRCESRITPEEKEELIEYLKQLRSSMSSSKDSHC